MAAARERWVGYAFVGPFLLIYAAVLVVPLVMGIVISLNRADLFGRREWIGLGNYAQALGDPVLAQLVQHVYSVEIVPELAAMERMGEKSAENLVASIAASASP